MGLGSNFNKFLLQKAPGAFEKIHISEYAFEKVAVDTSLYMHKFKAIHGDQWLNAFLGLVMGLRKQQVHSVFVFDGESPEEKKEEKERRRNQKEGMIHKLIEIKEAYEIYKKTGEITETLVALQKRRRSPPKVILKAGQAKFDPTRDVDTVWLERTIAQRENQLYEVTADDFTSLKRLLDLINVPWYVAVGEAEKMGAYLVSNGKVSSILTEDTDVMAYGTPSYLCRFDPYSMTCVRVSYSKVLEELNFTPAMFLDFCIMCGTDYNKNIPGVGSISAYTKLTRWKTIEAIGQSHPGIDISCLNHQTIRAIFTTFPRYDIPPEIPYSGRVDIQTLSTYLLSIGITSRTEDELRESLAQTTQIVLQTDNPDKTDHSVGSAKPNEED